MAKDEDEVPYNMTWDLDYLMRKGNLKKGKGKKARSLIEQLIDLFE